MSVNWPCLGLDCSPIADWSDTASQSRRSDWKDVLTERTLLCHLASPERIGVLESLQDSIIQS